MSIASQCDQFTATLKRQYSTKDAEGGRTNSWSTTPRTTLGIPTSIRCDMQMLTVEDKKSLGMSAEAIGWVMFCATDPKISTEDLVVWTDNSGKVRSCRVTGPSTDTRGRIWRAEILWDKTIQPQG